MPQSFVHLHSHSCFSLLDGLARIDDLLQSAVEQRMPALALTDHGTMFAAIEFYDAARRAGVKPIIGCEVYVADRPLDAPSRQDAQNYHLVLLAENEIGYRNLIRLTTEAHLRGFYRKPRVDRDLLQNHSEGLICLSACASSEVATAILAGDLERAEEIADWHRQVFDGRYYLELQYHNLEFQTTINGGIIHLSQRLGLPLVATNDVHYVRERHAHAHEVLLCIQTQSTLDDPKRMKMGAQEFYLKSPEQMEALFGGYPGAISNTLAIAERCNLELTFGRPHLPRFDTPDGSSSEDYLRKLCNDGLRSRYSAITADLQARLDYEISVILATGFVDYFLLVHDVMHFARSHGIAVGPGRGSAVGSLASYCLFVTNVDPVANGLSFERFLNPDRVTMPDMDLDFADDRRDEVIRYVTEKFGRDRVAQIITFGTIGPRAGVRDVGRALGMSYADVDRVAKLVPFLCHKVADAKERVPELKQLYEEDDNLRNLLDTVEDLEGVARHASTHAAGVVISRDPLIEHVPLYKVPKNDLVTTQYAMASIEKIALLKMDFLGLRTLTVMQRAAELIRRSTGREFRLDSIPLDDPSIYELLCTGDAFGVFQIDGQGMRKFIRQLKPTEFNHVIALVAMYRPGPMENIEEFAARKNGAREVSYAHPALEEVLKETYGILVYQEQVMRLAALVAGYTMAEGDLLRRAMAKKKPEELAKHREQFIARSVERGTSREVALRLFADIEPFAGYAFNKSHSAAYALLTCQTAYLKANFPREYLAGLMSAEMENPDRLSEALRECRRLRIPVLPPDVNESDLDFTLQEGGIRFGLRAIKHAGSAALESILAERSAAGPFTSLEDFCTRVDWGVANKRLIESLARCGALDGLGYERKRIVENLDRLVACGTTAWRQRIAGQASLFGDTPQSGVALQLLLVDAASLEEKIGWEQELLGIALSRHPIADAGDAITEAGALLLSDVSLEQQNATISVGGVVRGLRPFATKSGKQMATFQLTDGQTTIEAIVFNRNYSEVSGTLADGLMAVVDGRLEAEEGGLRLVVDGVCPLSEAKDRPRRRTNGNGHRNGNATGNGYVNGNGHLNGNGHANGNGRSNGHVDRPDAAGPVATRRVVVEFKRTGDRESDLNRLVALYGVLLRYAGNDEVELMVRQGHRLASVPLPVKAIGFCDRLEEDLRASGADVVRLGARA